jgi:hypothetical protein
MLLDVCSKLRSFRAETEEVSHKNGRLTGIIAVGVLGFRI